MIHHQEAGSGPPIVFLHGIGGSAAGWRPQLDHFAPRWRAIAWDMPGYGASTPLDASTIPELARALASFLEQAGAHRPVLVGHSIGGMIVQEALATHPVLARAIVLVQTSPAFGRPDGDWQRQFVADRLAPLDAGGAMPDLAAGFVAGMVGEAADPAGMALARASMAAVPDATYRAMVQALVGFDQRDALPRICVPTLVLAGTRDANAPAAMMERMAARIPGAQFVALDGVGHLAPFERPALFNATLDSFLDGLPS